MGTKTAVLLQSCLPDLTIVMPTIQSGSFAILEITEVLPVRGSRFAWGWEVPGGIMPSLLSITPFPGKACVSCQLSFCAPNVPLSHKILFLTLFPFRKKVNHNFSFKHFCF